MHTLPEWHRPLCVTLISACHPATQSISYIYQQSRRGSGGVHSPMSSGPSSSGSYCQSSSFSPFFLHARQRIFSTGAMINCLMNVV